MDKLTNGSADEGGQVDHDVHAREPVPPPSPVDHVDQAQQHDISSPPDPSESGLLWPLLYMLTGFLVTALLFILIIKLLSIWNSKRNLKKWGFSLLPHRPVVVGFFHPYCNAGGGGERVLWQSICALQSRYTFIRCVIYTGDNERSQPQDILDKVKKRFGIKLNGSIKFIYLKRRGWVEAQRWPRFTLLGQSIGSLILGIEAFTSFVPNVYIDTMGYAFTMPLFRWLGRCKTASYVHYPVVSRDMLQVVENRVCNYNNAKWISRSRILTRLKVYYYRLFAKLYGFVGRRSNVVMVNSTWTHNHISQLWKSKRVFIVYPPCDTSTFQQLPIARTGDVFSIVSVGQFRPEKNHELQLHILQEFLSYIDQSQKKRVKLVLIGSCRGQEDEVRVQSLRNLAQKLGIKNSVRFKVNASFDELQNELKNAKVALHTMKNEHFGIVLPECMAAGCVMVAHKSGGPEMDIVVNWRGNSVGFLADTKESFASCLVEVFNLTDLDRRVLVSAARESVEAKFSVNVFEASFLRATEDLFG